MDAARGQLRTAITLWFSEGDPVSIHTLAFAAYEIIHVVSKKRNRTRDLLFDSFIPKDECRAAWNKSLKRDANFFKHAKDDVDAMIEFDPLLSELFIMFAMFGLRLCGDRPCIEESAFALWFCLNRPAMLTDNGRKQFVDGIPVDKLKTLRSIPRPEFLEAFRSVHARELNRGAVLIVREPAAYL
jgi:hypothetical protein